MMRMKQICWKGIRIINSTLLLFLIVGLLNNVVNAIEPITGVLVAAGAVLTGGGTAYLSGLVDNVKCNFYECCNGNYIISDTRGLQNSLRKQVYGQHLVIDTVFTALSSHLKGHNKKALVLSFHGWTGGGKNYVSNIIAKHLYERGSRSGFVHHFIAGEHFPLIDEISIAKYKSDLRSWVRGNVTLCEHSLFIFDEADKMPLGVLDVLKPYMDYVEHVGHIDFRKSIFIFLSNTGGKDITVSALEHYQAGKRREDLTIFNMQKLLERAALNEISSGGLWNSKLISHQLIDLFIPFLPLEKVHIELCITDIIEQGHSDMSRQDRRQLVSQVLEALEWYPEEIPLYSVSGCKRLVQTMNNIIYQNMLD